MTDRQDYTALIAEARTVTAMFGGMSPIGNLTHRLAKALDVVTAERDALRAENSDAREHLHAKCDCVPNLGPPHCHLCSKDAGSPVEWKSCAAVVAEKETGGNAS